MPHTDVEDILYDVNDEVRRAMGEFPSFNSSHEGYAVIKEELDELWDEVKKKRHSRSNELLREEAIQVAAMAVRFVHDVCDR